MCFLKVLKSVEYSFFDVFDFVSFLPVGHFVFVFSVIVKVGSVLIISDL